MDVTKRVSWNWGAQLNEEDIIQLDENHFKINTYKKDYFIKCDRVLTDRIKHIRHAIYIDKEKNNHAVIRLKGYNVPIWYLACMVLGSIPENQGPRFNDYFCIFLDGDIYNFYPGNIIPIKITKELKASIKKINKKYIKDKSKGSIKETQEMFLNYAKETLLNNIIVDSNLNDAWVQAPKGGKKPIENFQHKRLAV